MPKFDSKQAMLNSLLIKYEPCWQCQECGKIYPSLEIMQKTPCTAHRGTVKCDCGHDAIFTYQVQGGLAKIRKDLEEKRRQREANKTPEERRVLAAFKECSSRWQGVKTLARVSMLSITSCITRALNNEDDLALKWEGERVSNEFESQVRQIKTKKIEPEDFPLEYADLLETNLRSYEFWHRSHAIAMWGKGLDPKSSQLVILANANMVTVNNSLIVPILNGGDGGKKTLDCLRKSIQDFVIAFDNKDPEALNSHASWRDFAEKVYKERLEDMDFWYSWYALVRLPLDFDFE